MPASDSREGEVLRRRISSGLPVTFSGGSGEPSGAPDWVTVEARGADAASNAAPPRGGASSSRHGRDAVEVSSLHFVRC